VSSRLETAKAKGASPSWLRVMSVLTPSTRPHWSSKGPPEWPRAMLAVWSRVLMPLIGRTLEKMPTERVGGSGVI